jgi:hypothetical protein
MELKKINKIQAKKLYNQGYKIILVGNRVSPHHFFSGWKLAFETKTDQVLDQSFESLCNNFYFYLEPELGSGIAFYIRGQ